MKCVNISHPEFKALSELVGNKLETELLVSRFQTEYKTDIFPTFNELKTLQTKSLNEILEKGFLKDMGFKVNKINDLQDYVDTTDTLGIAMLDKLILYKDTYTDTELAQVAGYLGFNLLSKDNNKVKSNLRFLIKSWDNFDSSFAKNKDILFAKSGIIPDKKSWYNQVRDMVVVDFLADSLYRYHVNPVEFDKVESKKWSKEDFNLLSKLIKGIYTILKKVGLMSNKDALSNLGNAIAYEMLSNNYDLYNYGVIDNLVKYKETIDKDDKAKEIVSYLQANGLLLTGSLAYRALGTVYRSSNETLHDLDFVIPHKVLDSGYLKYVQELKNALKDGDQTSAFKLKEQFKNTDIYKKLKSIGFEPINSFFGPDGYKDMKSLTITGIIDGEYNNGVYVEGTGYIIDLFIRHSPTNEDSEISFKNWRDIFVAKLSMNRYKDIKDFVNFKPFVESLPQYSFKYYPEKNITFRGYDGLKETYDNPELSRIFAFNPPPYDGLPEENFRCDD
jgi:hypothetical protein